jgi:hypothetical protein
MNQRSLRSLALLFTTLAWSCGDPVPRLVEADIPVSRTVSFHFDESRMGISGETPPGADEARIVRAVSRASTQRFIDARATQTEPSSEGGIIGALGLHEGWRQEFFALQRTYYESGARLAAGDLLMWDITPAGITREVGDGSIIPGVVNNFTGIFTRVIEVPTAASYSFRIDSDDGTIGTLQDLANGLHEVAAVCGFRATFNAVTAHRRFRLQTAGATPEPAPHRSQGFRDRGLLHRIVWFLYSSIFVMYGNVVLILAPVSFGETPAIAALAVFLTALVVNLPKDIVRGVAVSREITRAGLPWK